MNKYLFDQFSSIFNKGYSVCIMLVLQQEKPAFYDNIGIDSYKYKQLVNLITRIRTTFPYIQLFSFIKERKYKTIIFDITKNKFEYVKELFTHKPVSKDEINEQMRKEAKLFGYPTILVNIENLLKIRSGNINVKWYYITYILTEKGKKVGEVYTFFCKNEDFVKIQKDIENKKNNYNKAIENLKDYSILLCIEEKSYKRIIY